MTTPTDRPQSQPAATATVIVIVAAGQETDAFVAKLDGGNGTRLWGWQGGSEGNDYANAVAVDPTGDVYACGAAPLGMFADAESATPLQGEGTGAGAGAPPGPAPSREGDTGQADGFWSYTDGGSMSAKHGQKSGGAVADMFVAKVGRLCVFIYTSALLFG